MSHIPVATLSLTMPFPMLVKEGGSTGLFAGENFSTQAKAKVIHFKTVTTWDLKLQRQHKIHGLHSCTETSEGHVRLIYFTNNVQLL